MLGVKQSEYFVRVFAMVVFLLLSASSLSHAENKEKGFYIGAGAGYADHKDTCDEVFGESCDEEDLGWKVFGGYKLNRYIAVEGGAVDFGQSDAEIPFTNVLTSEVVIATLETKIDGFFLSGLFEWPMGDKFSVLTKLGMIYWDIELKGSGLPGNGELVGDEDENGTDLFFGLGAQYKISDGFAVRAEWERFTNIGNSDIDISTDIDLFSGSVVFAF